MEQCTREDLRAEIIATVFVADNGEPIVNAVESSDFTSDKPIFCVGPCGQDFSSWQDALAHLPTQPNQAGQGVE
jgi:hypothetical protein